MASIEIPTGISVKEFFLNFVPAQFKAQSGAVDLSAMSGKDFTLQFDIDGQKYGIRVKDGKEMEVIEGGMQKPMIEVSAPEKVWRFFISGGGGLEQFAGGQAAPSPAEMLQRYEKLQSTNGKLSMEIKQDDGATIPVSLTFNGVAEPSATLKVGMQDFIAMQQKKVDGQTLFMSGKLAVDGDLIFLMSLQSMM